MAALVLWSLLMYSLPAHKEFRFLLPALCLLMPYCGVALEDLASRFKEQCLAEEGLVLEVLDPRPALPACFLCTPCCTHRLCIVRACKKSSRELAQGPPHMPVRSSHTCWGDVTVACSNALLSLPADMPLHCLIAIVIANCSITTIVGKKRSDEKQ